MERILRRKEKGMDITDIRGYMRNWNNYVYGQGLYYCREIRANEELYRLCRRVMERLELTDKAMNGISVQGLPVINEGDSRVTFSDIFHELAGSFITPAFYVAKIVEAEVELRGCFPRQDAEITEIAGTVGRGLRAFPSFVREADLAYKLSQALQGARAYRDPEQDIVGHTDILLAWGGREYRIWSYQWTSNNRGLINTARRLSGSRGKLPAGIHVLAPINIFTPGQSEEQNGWRFYSAALVRRIGDAVAAGETEDYDKIRHFFDAAAGNYDYLKKIRLFTVNA